VYIIKFNSTKTFISISCPCSARALALGRTHCMNTEVDQSLSNSSAATPPLQKKAKKKLVNPKPSRTMKQEILLWTAQISLANCWRVSQVNTQKSHHTSCVISGLRKFWSITQILSIHSRPWQFFAAVGQEKPQIEYNQSKLDAEETFARQISVMRQKDGKATKKLLFTQPLVAHSLSLGSHKFGTAFTFLFSILGWFRDKKICTRDDDVHKGDPRSCTHDAFISTRAVYTN
jgi:hypothetical protein